jgi:hypothetical protein
MSVMQTASPRGMVHLVHADEPVPGFTLCGRRASANLYGRRVSWPRWSPADRGADPIHRTACPQCADRARQTGGPS